MRGEFVDLGGTRLYYYAAGTRGAGEPVVFLHGFPTSSRLWSAVIRDFPEGHRLVVCDLPGYGRSDPPRDDPSCEGHATAVLGLLDDLRILRACVVGHGLGGGVAQLVCLAAPERVSRLALIDSAAFDVAPLRLARLARAVGPFAHSVPPGLLAGLVHGSVMDGFATPERSRLALDTCLKPFTTPAGRDVLAAHLRTLGHCATRDVSARVGALGLPTAILWGADDPFYPVALGARLHAVIPDSSFDVVPGASHFLPEDAPERVVTRVAELLTR